MSSPPEFLSSVLANLNNTSATQSRPNVTLTFAQSLDAKIAGRDGEQLILSGKESMIMTHWMRTMHDAILVGIGTALNDDPQLNTRHLPPRPEGVPNAEHNNPYHLPRPVIIDSALQFSPDAKLLKNYREGRGRRPWIICSNSSSAAHGGPAYSAWSFRLRTLEDLGARVIPVPAINGRIPVPTILTTLHELGIRSLMVEGGARVIESFFTEDASSPFERRIIDTIILTVAPIFVGEDGVGYSINFGEENNSFSYLSTEMAGKDTVVALKAAKVIIPA